MKYHFLPNSLKFVICLSFLFVVIADIQASMALADEKLIFIGNSGIPKDTISRSDITNIYLGTKKKWGNGHKIIFVSLIKGETHKKFLKTYLNMDTWEYEMYWKRKLFSGKGQLPKFCSTDAQSIDYISKKSYAIGYVSKDYCNDKIENFCSKDVIILRITE